MARVSVAQLKPGDAFVFKGQPFTVIQIRSKHMGRGGAIYRVKMRNLKTGVILNSAFQPTAKFELIEVELQTVAFLYSDGQDFYFMNPKTFEQFSLPLKMIDNSAKFLKGGEKCRLEIVDGQPASLKLPLKIRRRVIEAPEAVAGNTAVGATKRVVIEGGMKIETPLFIKAGDIIVISTESGNYVSKGETDKSGPEFHGT